MMFLFSPFCSFLHNILIICCKNFNQVYELASVKQNPARADLLEEWHSEGGIMIIGYEMLRNLSQGTRIKNKRQKAIFHKTLTDPGKCTESDFFFRLI